jgi:type II secretory pathway component PulC
MSIINEALKKTEETIQRKLNQESIKPDTKRDLKAYLLYFFIFVIGLFLSSLIFASINHKVKTPQARGAPEAKTTLIIEKKLKENKILPAVAPLVFPEKQDKPKKDFILNGIFFSDNDGYALVNNQIVRENDSVDGAKVEKITANTVGLNNHGEVITLYTNR